MLSAILVGLLALFFGVTMLMTGIICLVVAVKVSFLNINFFLTLGQSNLSTLMTIPCQESRFMLTPGLAHGRILLLFMV